MTDHSPLHSSDDPEITPASLEAEVRLASEALGRVADANIHNHTEMLKAAVHLDHRLRSLLAAIEAERGGA
jgi:hypothetical protein